MLQQWVSQGNRCVQEYCRRGDESRGRCHYETLSKTSLRVRVAQKELSEVITQITKMIRVLAIAWEEYSRGQNDAIPFRLAWKWRLSGRGWHHFASPRIIFVICVITSLSSLWATRTRGDLGVSQWHRCRLSTPRRCARRLASASAWKASCTSLASSSSSSSTATEWWV